MRPALSFAVIFTPTMPVGVPAGTIHLADQRFGIRLPRLIVRIVRVVRVW